MITQEAIDVMNARFGDWVYFTEDYDAGNWYVPEGTGAMVRNELSPDREWIAEDHHVVDIDINGRHYEVEAPYDVLAMQ